MSWKQKTSTSTSGDFEQPPAGNHPAVLIGLIDLGTQQSSYQNGPIQWKRQVMLVWELTTEKMSGMKDTNHVIANRYTFSLNTKATLRKLLEDWRGRKYGDDEEVDLSAVLGKPCLLGVKHAPSGDKTYANVAGVQAVPKGLAVPAAQRTPTEWQVGYDLAKLPAWLPYLYGEPVADVIRRCKELTSGDAEGDASQGESGTEGNAEPVGAVPAGSEIPF